MCDTNLVYHHSFCAFPALHIYNVALCVQEELRSYSLITQEAARRTENEALAAEAARAAAARELARARRRKRRQKKGSEMPEDTNSAVERLAALQQHQARLTPIPDLLSRPCIVVANKVDACVDAGAALEALKAATLLPILPVSARQSAGLERLRNALRALSR